MVTSRCSRLSCARPNRGRGSLPFRFLACAARRWPCSPQKLDAACIANFERVCQVGSLKACKGPRQHARAAHWRSATGQPACPYALKASCHSLQAWCALARCTRLSASITFVSAVLAPCCASCLACKKQRPYMSKQELIDALLMEAKRWQLGPARSGLWKRYTRDALLAKPIRLNLHEQQMQPKSMHLFVVAL